MVGDHPRHEPDVSGDVWTAETITPRLLDARNRRLPSGALMWKRERNQGEHQGDRAER
jgi:hypothetical protein